MKISIQSRIRLLEWFKRRTEGSRIMQWISYIMIFSVLLVFIIGYPNEAGGLDWRFYLTVVLLGILLVLNILWDQSHNIHIPPERLIRLNWSYNILTSLLVLGAIAITGRFEIVFLLFMQTAQFAAFFGVWPAGVIFGAANLAATVGILTTFGVAGSSLFQAITQLLIGLIFVLVFVSLVDSATQETLRAERLLKELQAVNFELKTAQRKEKDLAIAEERVRLARDIHDGLGHHLTVLSIQLQAADKLVERNPKEAVESIRQCRAEAQAALEEVRRSVGMMRESPEESRPLEDVLENLIQDFEEHTGLKCNYEQGGIPLELSAFARQTLFRAVQEGLTNVHKHARGASHIQITLDYDPEKIHLIIRDDGKLGDKPLDRSGFGLRGLQERVDQLGGELCCGPSATGGFEVEVRIPLQEAVNDQNPAG